MIVRVILALTLAFAPCAAGAALLGENDFQHAVRLEGPAISPDGKRAVVVVSRINWNEDKYEDELWIVDLASRAQRALTYGRKGLSDPAFSPDGTRLAFIADDGDGDDAHSQVFVMPLDGGDARPVTHAKEGVEQFAWRPDGRAVAYAAEDAQRERKGADRFRDSFVFTTEPITARSRPQPVHLFVQPLGADATATQLTFGPESVAAGEGESTLSWSPDEKTIAFVLCPNAILNDESYSRVALVDVASKVVRPLTGHGAWESDPLFSPDGTHVAYTYSNGDSQVNLAQLYVTTPAGGPGSAVSAPVDRPISDSAWARDSKSVYFAVPDRATNALYRVALGGEPQRLPVDLTPGTPGTTTGAAVESSLRNAIAADGTLVFVGTATKQPPELFARLSDGTLAKLTEFNRWLAQYDLATAERITYPTLTGITADGVLYLPPGFTPGRKYPLSVYIHGGPTSSSSLIFDFWAQVMAARGWIVLRPNYRGSDDLGLAYQRAVLYDPEEGPGKDIMAAVDSVRARGIVDDSRIAVSGWSYGGIMTAWMISKYHIWKAAVSGASVNDWTTDYGTADDSLADVDLFHGSPFTGSNAAEWRRASAVWYAKDVTTPTLILSDVGDNRDPFATSSIYWRALRDNHKDATLRVWPVYGHFPSDPVRTVDVYHYWLDFIAQHFR
ncbi:MAG: S9 family peptidase [Candidatus Eremiobacteraeota bacterium]|nr:S9 family peptidase [Candidatus Eremiobacteraeota bacterium]